MRVSTLPRLILPLVTLALPVVAVEAGDNKALELLTPFAGSFSQVVPIQVPAFRGLEPKIGLGYSSEAGNGFVGVGWSLGGVSVIQRAGPGRGTPRYDSTDIYLLDGRELLPCPTPVTSVSCSNGGTHSSKNESYTKIQLSGSTWTIWSPDGTRTILTAVYATKMANAFRWGTTSRIDTNGNTVTYTWAFDSEDSYLDQVTYGPYSIKIYRETRPDILSFTVGEFASIGETKKRLRSILIKQGSSVVRAYKASYDTSPVNGRSRLTSVQQFGRDVVIDVNGFITGGTSLPARTFTYQNDPLGHTFQTWPN
jgi:hypothetical protein